MLGFIENGTWVRERLSLLCLRGGGRGAFVAKLGCLAIELSYYWLWRL